jgi:predicted O-methyltransferase YrrM
MELRELEEKLSLDLKRQLISPSVLLDGLRIIDDEDRKSSQYVDPLYVPFYYHLGKYLKPKSLLECGFGLAFLSTCFMKSCRTVEVMFALQERVDEFYSNRIAIKNIKTVFDGTFYYHYGQILDATCQEKLNANNWDLAFLNDKLHYDKHMLQLDIVWDHLNDGGHIVADNIIAHTHAATALMNFCKIKNIKPIIFKTRFGTGIIQK